ncbi:MAG: TonB family protein [Thermoanaerobaculia bacterium]|nr:TonB family protein [Thermoanaerobaculia bacterium]
MSRPASRTPKQKPAPSNDIFDVYLREDDEDRNSLRISLIVAGLVHLVLLSVTLPAMSGPEIPEPEEKTVFLVAPPPRWKKPPPPPPETQPQEVREIPMPDDTPDDPEPIVLDEPDPVEMPEISDTLDLAIPEAPPAMEPEGPVVVGGEIERPERVHYVDPVYPDIARRARVEGAVILEAIIAKDGTVRDLRVLKSRPFQLTEAALDAVKKWRYSVSTLNGKPVEVKMTVTVIFSLS